MMRARLRLAIASLVGVTALARADTVNAPVLSSGGIAAPGLVAVVGEMSSSSSGAGVTLNSGGVGCWAGGFGVPGDINGDGVVDSGDQTAFVLVLLGLDTNPGRVSASDLNGDGIADGRDIAAFLSIIIHP